MANADAYRSWLERRASRPAEIIRGLQNEIHPMRLDQEGLAARGWSTLSPDWEPPTGELWAGGYLENRSIYDSPVFRPEGEMPRSLHLGLDVFAPAGTLVYAPLEGFIHSFQINGGELDYGPTILLQHEISEDLIFWTLYGHLSEGSLFGVDEGDFVSAGETLGELGTRHENGGWAPHLHFQVILDIGDWKGDFPGVCRVSERQKWEAICPSPFAFLGVML